ncbi:sensor histidine kinase [Mucilaginibacter sp. cycad4]|uniref:sensor histidine kinase n=1 Tax=Mucilaginibacter sp. cycad4 TaxID=3342096 RepID=UPI002AAACD19|nr:sensor histidine kinase [Mucilaginibacter gossypii]WPU99041.1 sensor histidine kinase [Mucilaginibacter gossypii]
MVFKRTLVSCYLTLLFVIGAYAQQLSQEPNAKAIRQLSQGSPDSTAIKHLLDFGRFYLEHSFNSNKYVDSALLCYQLALTQSTQIHSLKWQMECTKLKALCSLNKLDFDKGEENFMKVISYYHAERDILTEADNWIELADNLPIDSPSGSKKKIDYIKHGALLYHQLNNKFKESEALKMIADVHLNEGKLDQAQNELLDVLAKYRALNYKKLYETYYLLASVYALKADLKNELFYRIETVKSMESSGDTADAILYYFKLAGTYTRLLMYDNSVYYLKKCLNYVKPKDYEYFVVLEQIVQGLIRQDKANEALAYVKTHSTLVPEDNLGKYRVDLCFASCYEALRQNKNAEFYFLRMNRESETDYQHGRNPDESRLLDIKRVCDFYLSTKQFEKAKHFLNLMINHRKNLVSPIVLNQIKFIEFKIDSASGNYLAALKNFQQYKMSTDSMFSATKSKQIAEMMVRFESDKKDKNIQLLEKQSLVEKSESEKRQLLIRLSTAGIILLLVLLGVLYNRYLLKQRNVKLLQERERTVSNKNRVLAKLLKDNEWLLKEIHHRVKNNLHMITGLLRLQARHITDTTALDAIHDSQNRVIAMSLIHQKLYKTDNKSNVYMPEYIDELVRNLRDCYKTGQQIVFDIDVMPFVLDVSQALPIGLILNELITNAIKYAFPYSNQDRITIKLSSANSNEINLYVSDNGQGLPDGFKIGNPQSFGMILIQGLVDDLGGTMFFESKNGTILSLTFKVDIAIEMSID